MIHVQDQYSMSHIIRILSCNNSRESIMTKLIIFFLTQSSYSKKLHLNCRISKEHLVKSKRNYNMYYVL